MEQSSLKKMFLDWSPVRDTWRTPAGLALAPGQLGPLVNLTAPPSCSFLDEVTLSQYGAVQRNEEDASEALD